MSRGIKDEPKWYIVLAVASLLAGLVLAIDGIEECVREFKGESDRLLGIVGPLCLIALGTAFVLGGARWIFGRRRDKSD